MSKLCGEPRIKRKHDPERDFARTKYRNALAYLLEDFGNRCAYSMVHLGEVGDSEKHIDHFDPASKRKPRVKLGELFLASPHCNMAKGDSTPIASEKKLGIRFLNPCAETDYNVEIFEDPSNAYLVGTTPRAKWHILKLGLNAPHLVKLRQKRRLQRASIQQFESDGFFLFTEKGPIDAAFARFKTVYDLLKEAIENGIPPINPPPTVEKKNKK